MTSIMLGNALFPLPGTPQATEMPIDLGATQNAWFGQYFAPKLTTDYKIMLNIDSKLFLFHSSERDSPIPPPSRTLLLPYLLLVQLKKIFYIRQLFKRSFHLIK